MLYTDSYREGENNSRPNQAHAKTKGRPTIMSYLKKKHIGVRKTQLKLLNELWLNASAHGILLIPIEEHGDIFRGVSRNWKRDLNKLHELYLIKYVQVETDDKTYSRVNGQATLMVNPAINFVMSKWEMKLKRDMITLSWESGLFTLDYAEVPEE